MSSSFLGLSIAYSGLMANQYALGVTSHNIANVNTLGYSRQRLDMTQFRPDILSGLGAIGVGVDVTAITQIRDPYNDYKLREEVSVLGEWITRAGYLAELEGVFNEPSDSSITKLLDNYYASIQELSKNPENLTARTLVRQNAIALADGVNRMSKSLSDMQKDMNFEVKNTVDEVNRISNEIAALNKIIYESELGGNGQNNDVRDQRNVLLDELSQYVAIEYKEDTSGRFNVSVGGHLLVSHFRADQLEVRMRSEDHNQNETDADGLYDVFWADGSKLITESGQLKGLLDMRDQSEGDLKGIPYYINKLDEFATTFTAEVNRIHQSGYGLDGSTGVAMFTINGMSTAEFEDYLRHEGLNGRPGVDVTSAVMDGVTDDMSAEEYGQKIAENINKLLGSNDDFEGKSVRLVGDQYLVVDKISASELTVSMDMDDLDKLATATTAEDLPGSGTNMLSIFNTRHNQELFAWGAPEDFIKSLVSNLGVDANQANNVVANQQTLVNFFIVQRESISGVSLDEEMTNMIKYQNAYNANARMVNVFDEMLDLIVNRLGTVGR